MSDLEYKETILSNKGVLGKFKDELEGRQAQELLALKPKLYSILGSNVKDTKTKLKGIPYTAAQKFKHNNFKKCLEATQKTVLEDNLMEDTIQQTSLFFQFKSTNHQIYTIKQIQIAMTGYKEKKWYMNSYTSLPHGHYNAK